MSTMLPEGISPGDEAQIEWVADEDAVMVTVSLSDATIICESRSELGGAQLALLVGGLQSILVRAFDAMEEDRG